MSITSSGSPASRRARRSRRGRSAAPPRRRSACARRGRSAPRTVARELGAVGRVAHGRGHARRRARSRAVLASIASAYRSSTSNTRCLRRVAERGRSASTPSPSRVTTERRSTSSTRRRRRRRRSAAASSSSRCRRPRRGSVGLVRHRLAGQRGEQVVDGDLGHLVRACRTVAEPTWGTTSRFGASSSGWSAGSGSGSVTSSAAPAIAPLVQRALERGGVDDRAARGVDEQRRRLHARERGRVDQVARLRRERAVEA